MVNPVQEISGRCCTSLVPKRRAGFTLIELLVVLAVLAMLGTLALPRYLNHVERSKEAVLKENLDTTRRVLGQFYADRGRYPSSLQELVDLRYLRTLPMDPMLERDDAWLVLPPAEGVEGNVYDIKSSSEGISSEASPYSSW